jgi:hypothetical protein
MSAKCNSEIAVIGSDVGKNSFHIVGSSGHLLELLTQSGHLVRRVIVPELAGFD